ncbi:MAG: ATP-binding cassette domain-containing protein, partial [Candidatus Latescibacterota bacterium]
LQEADRLRLWGDVLIDGISVFSMGREALLRQRREMGMVMANGGLVDNMDVERNVSLPLAYHVNNGGDLNVKSRCAEVLDAVGIPERQRKGIRPVSLNREERIRVAIGRALVTNPRIFMVDDALVGLDQVATDQLVSILCGSQTENADLRLLTTSRLAPFLWRADHFFLLVEGKLIYLGDSEKVVEHAHPWVKKDREGITFPI